MHAAAGALGVGVRGRVRRMAKVTIELPSLLTRLLEAPASIAVEATTLDGALRGAITMHPALEGHLFDETGAFRQHVLCFHNDTNTRWLPPGEVSLADGDRVTILQAVSGG